MFIIYNSVSVYRILVNVFRIGSRKPRVRLSSHSLKIKGGAAPRRASTVIDQSAARRRTSAVNERRAGTIPPLSSAFHSDNNVHHGNTLLYMSFSGVKGCARGCHSVATTDLKINWIADPASPSEATGCSCVAIEPIPKQTHV